ncbi:hypothetical protein AYI70_g4430 [Smittium culicis]|nr:hypothetical protein AYI70_g4430 [Smittium culicis]
MLILNRLQSKKTPKYVKLVTKFVGFFSAIDSTAISTAISSNNYSSMNGEYVTTLISTLNEIQPQLLAGLLSGILVSSIDNTIRNFAEIKYVTVGYMCLINNPTFFEFSDSKVLFSSVLANIIKLVEDSTSKVSKQTDESINNNVSDGFGSQNLMPNASSIDDEQDLYQSSFSKLSTLDGLIIDPCPLIKDLRVFMGSVIKAQVSTGNSNFTESVSLLQPTEKSFVDLYFRSA